MIDFKVGNIAVGTNGSELKLAQPGKVKVSAKVEGGILRMQMKSWLRNGLKPLIRMSN